MLLLCSTASFGASIHSIEREIICEEGYKFLIVFTDSHNYTPSVVQIFEDVTEERKGVDYRAIPQPIKCEDDK